MVSERWQRVGGRWLAVVDEQRFAKSRQRLNTCCSFQGIANASKRLEERLLKIWQGPAEGRERQT